MYKEGEKVVCIGDFSDVRKIWRFKYPVKNDVLTIKSCVKHQQYTFWLLKFMEYTTEEQPTTGYCDLNFRKIEEVEEIEFMKLETCIKDLWWISRSALSGMETVPTAYDRRKYIMNSIKTHYPQLIQDKSIKSIWQTIIYETTILQPI